MMNTVSLIGGEVLDESAQTALDEGTLTAQRFLRAIASDEYFLTKVAIAFGDSFDAEKVEDLRQQWEAENFDWLPAIEIRNIITGNNANNTLNRLAGNDTLNHKSLVFIDSAIDNYSYLVESVQPGIRVFILNSDEDGMAQITAILTEFAQIASIHIVSHGSPGNLCLGSTQLNLETLDQYLSQFQKWRDILSADATLLLYGCEVAADLQGVAFVERLQSLVGANIAASTTLTGNLSKGGNWQLELTTSQFEPTLAFDLELVAAYPSILPIPGFPSYRTVEETFRDLEQLAANNSGIAKWLDIGDSFDKTTPGGASGFDIQALELTNTSKNLPDGKPTLYVQGGIHARELTTPELVNRFGEFLVNNYGKDPEVTWLLDFNKIALVPIVNPDGRKQAEMQAATDPSGQGSQWRKNTNPGDGSVPFPNFGVDLNRNYDSKWGQIPGGSSSNPADLTFRGTAPFSEPETQAVSAYVSSLFPDQRGQNDADAAPDNTTGVYIDVHSYGNDILYPWGWTRDPAPNQDALRTLGLKFGFYNNTSDTFNGNSYTGTPYNVYQSSGLYLTDGTSDDWAYEKLGVAAYTFEIGNAFFEPSSAFENSIFPQNLSTLLYAAKSAHRPYQTSFGPESLSVGVNSGTITAGKPVILTAIADDTRYFDSNAPITFPGAMENPRDKEHLPSQNITTARYSIDAPSWVPGIATFPLNLADGVSDSSQENLTAAIDTSNLSAGSPHHFCRKPGCGW
jgi:hypothetical protein